MAKPPRGLRNVRLRAGARCACCSPPAPRSCTGCPPVRCTGAVPGAGEDCTYGRPARRSTALPGTVLPSLRRRPPRVSVVIDTSGSVGDAEPGSALPEVAAIARAVGGCRDLVTVVPCDASAGAARRLCRAEGIPLTGGGGTDLRAGFTRALRTRPRPRRHRRPHRRPDALAGHPAAVPHGGGPVPPPLREPLLRRVPLRVRPGLAPGVGPGGGHRLTDFSSASARPPGRPPGPSPRRGCRRRSGSGCRPRPGAGRGSGGVPPRSRPHNPKSSAPLSWHTALSHSSPRPRRSRASS